MDSRAYPFFLCDAPGCTRHTAEQPTLDAAVGWARMMGWLIEQQRAVCPWCQPRGPRVEVPVQRPAAWTGD